MHTLNYPETTKWVVAHNNTDVYHVSEVHSQNCFITGQPFINIFESKEDLLNTFPQLSAHFDF